ncbi:MAG TPA: Gfo/Idh/MocA family oxidoreductase [Clostridiales bacterium]|nr:Gfo/Idh/MocA family oxidoreductase [Clostridiales bacterium]
MSNVNLAIIGQGGRGFGLMRLIMEMEDVNIVGVCDVYQDRVDRAVTTLKEAGKPAPVATQNYHELLALSNVDAVLIATSWQTHMRIAIDSMKAGKYVASEVGGACSLDEVWELVQTSRETKMPCMMLENCCYGREELALLNMVKQNVFGELIHTRCGYEHDLREEVAKGHINRHYRLDNYMHRNGDVYPTHGSVPMGKMLNINRGNRFVSLTSMASKSRGLNEWIKDNLPDVDYLQNYPFALGDVVTTIVKCAHGETLVMTHDTTLPRPYSRGGLVQGTKGIWMEENYSIYLDGISPEHKWEPFAPYLEKYEHPLWKWYQQEGIRGGHGGMDYLTLRAFLESVQAQCDTPIDVYDFAVHAALTPLSEQSVALGGMPQAFPDFTNGAWLVRPAERKWKYSLTEIWDGE